VCVLELLQRNQYLEQQQVCDMAILPARETRERLYRLFLYVYCALCIVHCALCIVYSVVLCLPSVALLLLFYFCPNVCFCWFGTIQFNSTLPAAVFIIIVLLCLFDRDKWVNYIELSKRNDFNPSTNHYFWYLDLPKLKITIKEHMYQTLYNLTIR
jgi:hypothetical protein